MRGGETTVAVIMAKAGLTCNGQFALDYRRTFNELPFEAVDRAGSAGSTIRIPSLLLFCFFLPFAFSKRIHAGRLADPGEVL